MGFFDEGLLSESLFEQQMLGLERWLQEDGIKAFKELRNWRHKLSAEPTEEKELYKRLSGYGINVRRSIFPGDQWTTTEIKVYREVGLPLEFTGKLEAEQYFSLLDEFYGQRSEEEKEEINEHIKRKRVLMVIAEKIVSGEIR